MVDITNINVVELTRQVFSLGAIRIPVKGLSTSIEYDDIEVFDLDGNYPKSALFNTATLDTVLFKKDGKEIYHLIASPIISVNRPKHIIKSRVRRRAGTVKELISLGDFVGTIKGVLTNQESADPPYGQMADLQFLNDSIKEWEVESDLFTELGIYNIVIEDIQFPASPGIGNSQPYIITFISDEPITLNI